MSSSQSPILSRVLTVGAILGFGGFFYSQSLAPLQRDTAETTRQLGELQMELDSAGEAIHEIEVSEKELAEACAALNRRASEETGSSLMVSFPASARQHFARIGLPSPVVRLNTIEEEPDLPGYQRIYWSVGVPIAETERNVTGLLLAVAELEQQNHAIRVLDFSIQPNPEDPKQRVVGSNIVAFVRK